MKNKILCGNTIEKLKELDNDSIDMVVTSPPYYFLRSYEGDNVAWGGKSDCEHEWELKERKIRDIVKVSSGQEEGKHSIKALFCKHCNAWKGKLGNEPHPNMFIDNLVSIFQEVKRVLKPTGNFYLNIGDTYFGGNMCVGQPDDWDSISTSNREKKYYNDDFNKLVKQRNKLRSNWLKPKQLMLIPARVAIAMQNDGWILRNDLIWCLSGSTKVYAKTQKMQGPMLIKDIVRLNTNTVSLWDGSKWNKVNNFYKSEETDGLMITLRNGEKISSTLNHRWITKDGIKKTKELEIGDVLKKAVLPEPEKVKNLLCLNDEDIGYFVGMYIAEGSFGKQDSVIQISSHSNEKERYRKLKLIAEKYHGTCRKHDYGNVSTINIYGNVLVGIIKHYVYGKNAHTKGLQPRCWSRSNNFLLSLLRGYLDGDGHYEAKNDRYRLGFTRNKRLADDLRTLCGRLGIRIKLQSSISRIGDKEFKSFRGEIRFNKSVHKNCKNDGEVINIENSRGNNFYDIELKDEPHVFSLSSGVLTHNSKPNPMPSSVTDRRNNAYEHVFHFVKEPRYYYNLDAIRIPHRSSPIDRKEKTYVVLDDDSKTKSKIKRHINNVYELAKEADEVLMEGSKTIGADDKIKSKQRTTRLATTRKVARDYIKENKLVGAEKDAVLDYATTCSNPSGKNPGNVVRVEDCEYQGYAKSAHGTQDYHVSGKNPGNVLEVNTQPFRDAHFACFPPKLIEPLIKAGCPQKVCKKCGKPMIRETEDCDCDAGYQPGIVMDIFAGSGTACLVAKEMGRDYIGIELGENYCQMARKRLSKVATVHKWQSEQGASIDDLEF